MIAFSKAITTENGHFRINVNCVSPGATATPATGNPVKAASSGDEEAQARLSQLLRLCPIGRGLQQRLGMPRDIANVVASLISDRAEWITGQTLSVSGEYLMLEPRRRSRRPDAWSGGLMNMRRAVHCPIASPWPRLLISEHGGARYRPRASPLSSPDSGAGRGTYHDD